VPFQG